MADHKQAIIKFKKTASADDKQKVIDDLKAKGGQVTKDDNLNSSIFPFIAASIPEDHFQSISSGLGDHDTIDLIEEDGEVKTQ